MYKLINLLCKAKVYNFLFEFAFSFVSKQQQAT